PPLSLPPSLPRSPPPSLPGARYKHGTCTGLDQYTYMTTTIAGITTATPTLLGEMAATAAAASPPHPPSLPLPDLETAFGGPGMAVLMCNGKKYLTGVYTCWTKDSGTHKPYARMQCPPAVVAEGTCPKGGEVVVPIFKA
ncbi:conserved unknown protein, partial [Nannochloropsis gaditana]